MSDEYWAGVIVIDILAFYSLLTLTNNFYFAIAIPIAIGTLPLIVQIRQKRHYKARRRPVNTEIFWKALEPDP